MSAGSAGLLIYRVREAKLEFLLVHPGGPFWRNKDAGAWSIPKGEIGPHEDPLAAAKRECKEETGFELSGPFLELTPIKQKGGKLVRAWAVAGDFDAAKVESNTFTLEWPPHSGKTMIFPEIDRAAWFPFDEARERINPAQIPFLEETRGKLLSD